MKRLFTSFVLLVVFTTLLNLCSFAEELENAKAVLIKNMPSLTGEGAVITGPISIEEIEKKSLEEISECQSCPQVPFGYDNDRWLDFKSHYELGDVILYFSTSNNSWEGLYGREGYALVRAEAVIDMIITKMN